MTRTTISRSVGAAVSVALLASASPAAAQAQLPELPSLPELPAALPKDPDTGLPVDPGTGLPVDPGTLLPGPQPGGGTNDGGAEGGGAGGGTIDAAGLDPVISGPSKARTVRVDSKGRFRVAGVGVACPEAAPGPCSVSVRVANANGSTLRFVKRTFSIQPGSTLSLKKLKVSKKALRALRTMRVARVVTAISAHRPGGAKASRAVGLKLKPAKK